MRLRESLLEVIFKLRLKGARRVETYPGWRLSGRMGATQGESVCPEEEMSKKQGCPENQKEVSKPGPGCEGK